MTDIAERVVLPTTVLHHKGELSVEVVDKLLPETTIVEARQEEETKKLDTMPVSPQEMGQEAQWVEKSPRWSVWKIPSPSNDSAKKSHKAKIILLDGSSTEGGDVGIEVTADTASISSADKEKHRQANDKAKEARNYLARALANSVPEQRLKLVESAFEHAEQACRIMGLECQSEDHKQARDKGFTAIQSTESSDASVWKCLTTLLPPSLSDFMDKMVLEAVNTEQGDDQDISTLGFNNTFELPSANNADSKQEGFDLMSMSSLNEILDGPLDTSPGKTNGNMQTKKKRLRLAQMFRSRKSEGGQKQPETSSNLTSAVTKDSDKKNVIKRADSKKCKVTEMDDRKTAGRKPAEKERSLAKISNDSSGFEYQKENLSKKHTRPQKEISFSKPAKDLLLIGPSFVAVSKDSPAAVKHKIPNGLLKEEADSGNGLVAPSIISCEGHVDADVDSNLVLEHVLSQSPSIMLEDKYKISIFEDDARDKYEVQADKEEGCYETWDPCGEITGIEREGDRYTLAANQKKMVDDSDEEMEKYFVEEDKYLVENVADGATLEAFAVSEIKKHDSIKDQAVKKRGFRLFQRRHSEKYSVEPLHKNKDAQVDMSYLQQHAITSKPVVPLKRSNSKRSTKSSKNDSTSTTSRSSQSYQERALAAKAKRQKPLKASPALKPKSAIKNWSPADSSMGAFKQPLPYMQVLPSPKQMIRQSMIVDDNVRPVRISVVASADREAPVNAGSRDRKDVGYIQPVAEDPLFQSIKGQQIRHDRRGLDPVTAADEGDDRGIDP